MFRNKRLEINFRINHCNMRYFYRKSIFASLEIYTPYNFVIDPFTWVDCAITIKSSF